MVALLNGARRRVGTDCFHTRVRTYALRHRWEIFPHLIHRLDKGVSGLMLVRVPGLRAWGRGRSHEEGSVPWLTRLRRLRAPCPAVPEDGGRRAVRAANDGRARAHGEGIRRRRPGAFDCLLLLLPSFVDSRSTPIVLSPTFRRCPSGSSACGLRVGGGLVRDERGPLSVDAAFVRARARCLSLPGARVRAPPDARRAVRAVPATRHGPAPPAARDV